MLAYLNQKGHPSNFFYRNLKGVFYMMNCNNKRDKIIYSINESSCIKTSKGVWKSRHFLGRLLISHKAS